MVGYHLIRSGQNHRAVQAGGGNTLGQSDLDGERRGYGVQSAVNSNSCRPSEFLDFSGKRLARINGELVEFIRECIRTKISQVKFLAI